jgi:hypothetical protein
MRFILTHHDTEDTINGEAAGDDDGTWISNIREAAWEWCIYKGGGPVTARESGGEDSGRRILTVSYEIHDE